MKVLAVMLILLGLTNLFISTSAWTSGEFRQVTQKVLFGIEIDGQKQGRIVIGLFGENVPKTVKIFADLAKAKEGEGYKGSKVSSDLSPYHVYIRGGIISRDDGIEDKSDYGGLPNDENLTLNYISIGYVSVANSVESKDKGIQFVINYTSGDFRKIRYVVFGKVLEGMDVVGKIARKCEGTRSKDCIIAESEVVEVDELFIVPF